MGHTSTGTPVSHDAVLAVAYCLIIGIVSVAGASYLFRHRTAA
jgi:ABC-2 type transport system permease protein